MARKPFFMRFIETAPAEPVRTDVRAGDTGTGGTATKSIECLKWPSDRDDLPVEG